MSPAPASPPIANHAIILAHPTRSSFNGAVTDTYVSTVEACGQAAIVRDLYAMEFDPVLKAAERPTIGGFTPSADVAAEQALLRGCDALVLVYPIWFGTPPAMLKGYVERVLGAGVVPKAVETRAPGGFLAGKRLVSFTSSGASDAWLAEQGELLALRTLFDRYLMHAFGMRSEQHFHFPRIVPHMGKQFVDEYLTTVHEQAKRICGELLIEHYRTRPTVTHA